MADDPSSSSQPSSSSSAAGPSAQRHTFWETQPVVQARPSAAPHEAGPIDPARDLAGVRPEPYRLPKDFEWCTCNLEDPREVEEVYTLLTTNYVEDDDGCFRFNYSAAFLDWALRPPGYHKVRRRRPRDGWATTTDGRAIAPPPCRSGTWGSASRRTGRWWPSSRGSPGGCGSGARRWP